MSSKKKLTKAQKEEYEKQSGVVVYWRTASSFSLLFFVLHFTL